MSQPLVTIVIPTYNRADLLPEAVRSARDQTYPNIEIVIVDDCSQDMTDAVAADEMSKDQRVAYFKQEQNLGACPARNRGVRESRGDLIAFLDSDDLFHPLKVERQVARLMEQSGAGLTACQTAHFEQRPEDAALLWNTFDGDDPRERFLRHDPVWSNLAPLWRRETFLELGGYDESLPMAQEYELFTRSLLLGVEIDLSNELLAFCRRHDAPSISSDQSLRRFQTLERVFLGFEPLLDKANSRKSRDALAQNFYWLAGLAAVDGHSELASRCFSHARKTDPSALRARLAATTALPVLTGLARLQRGFLYRRLQSVYRMLGMDIHEREQWFCRHRIEDEPGLRTFPFTSGEPTEPA
jgi:glycosyltransferase involved in cell wall biosynthesis